MKKFWLLTLIVLMVAAVNSSAFAWTSETEDRPFRFADGSGTLGYYVWRDSYGFHLWALSGNANHVFSGTIRTDGKLFNIRGHHLESGESFGAYPEIQNRFWFENQNPAADARHVFAGLVAESSPHKIFFKLNAAGSSEGIYFNVVGASYIGFDLQIDGHGAARNQIWYGGSSWHPENFIFKFENK